MNTIFNEKINNLDDAKFFIEVLVTNELSFNFEEDAQNLVDCDSGEETFSPEDANCINDRLDEMITGNRSSNPNTTRPDIRTYAEEINNNLEDEDRTYNTFVGGYFNDTDNIDAISFKFSSGNIDSGTFKLYGVS